VVAYDEDLAHRIRELVAQDIRMTEKKMFGGLAFLIGGHMAIAVSREGGVMVRVDPKQTESLLATTNATPFEMNGKETRGWVRVAAEGVRTKPQLKKWTTLGTNYASSLPKR
jgi:hypothetical protein